MTGAEVPNAIAKARPLMDLPGEPDIVDGYLDLLGGGAEEPPGLVQAAWASRWGSAAYDKAQTLMRKLVTTTRLPASVYLRARGGRVLDVGCGPGDITASLGRVVGPDGLALGVDVSRPMLRRATVAAAGDRVGFLRADARELPFHDETFDVVSSLAVLQLIPSPFTVLEEMSRVLAPGGRMALLIPTVRGTLFEQLSVLLPERGGLRFFSPDEIAENLHRNGLATVHTRQHPVYMWVLADKAGTKSG